MGVSECGSASASAETTPGFERKAALAAAFNFSLVLSVLLLSLVAACDVEVAVSVCRVEVEKAL